MPRNDDGGSPAMRDACPHFNDWLNQLADAVR